MSMTIRVAHPEDAIRVHAIYAPVVLNTPISFEFDVPSVEEIRTRMGHTLETHPWLVAECDGHVGGYAYATTFRARRAYQWCADVSIYIDQEHRRKGLARSLYNCLFALLRAQGFITLHAGITLPNPASEKLHESFGFEKLGVLRHVGYKQGAWHDVGVFQKDLGPRPESPNSPILFHSMNPTVVSRVIAQHAHTSET